MYLQVEGVVGEENQAEEPGSTASIQVPPPLVQLHSTSSTSGSCQPDSLSVQVANILGHDSSILVSIMILSFT